MCEKVNNDGAVWPLLSNSWGQCVAYTHGLVENTAIMCGASRESRHNDAHQLSGGFQCAEPQKHLRGHNNTKVKLPANHGGFWKQAVDDVGNGAGAEAEHGEWGRGGHDCGDNGQVIPGSNMVL